MSVEGVEEEEILETIDICGPKSSDLENNFIFQNSGRYGTHSSICAVRFNSSGITDINLFSLFVTLQQNKLD